MDEDLLKLIKNYAGACIRVGTAITNESLVEGIVEKGRFIEEIDDYISTRYQLKAEVK